MSGDRNTGWLPEGFESNDLDAPRRMARRVQTRVVVHGKRVRMAQGIGALAALAVLLGVAPLLWRSAGQPTGPSQMAGTVPGHSGLSVPGHSGLSGIQAVPPEVTLAKASNGVELAWRGNPSQEFVVYRCTSPKFDQCSIAGVVKGTRWVDSGSDVAPVVFYRVEPKA